MVAEAKFVIHQMQAGKYRFILKANNGQIIATSLFYNSPEICRELINTVKRLAPVAQIEDRTAVHVHTKDFPKFQIYSNNGYDFSFHLLDEHGAILAYKEGYQAKSSCFHGIYSAQKTIPNTAILDGTILA